MSDVTYEAVEKELERLRETDEYKSAYAKVIAAMYYDLDRRAIRCICPHLPEFHEYWTDASGNNGGGYYCAVCNKDL